MFCSITIAFIWPAIRKTCSFPSLRLRSSRSSSATRTTSPFVTSSTPFRPSTAIFRTRSFFRITTSRLALTPTWWPLPPWRKRSTIPVSCSMRRTDQTTTCKPRSLPPESRSLAVRLRSLPLSVMLPRNLTLVMPSVRKLITPVMNWLSWRRSVPATKRKSSAQRISTLSRPERTPIRINVSRPLTTIFTRLRREQLILESRLMLENSSSAALPRLMKPLPQT